MALPNSSSLHLLKFTVIHLLDGWPNRTPDKVWTIPCTTGINLTPEYALINSPSSSDGGECSCFMCEENLRCGEADLTCQSEKGDGKWGNTTNTLEHSSSCPKSRHPEALTEPRRSWSAETERRGFKDEPRVHVKLLQHQIWEERGYFWLIFFCFWKPDPPFLLGLLSGAVARQTLQVFEEGKVSLSHGSRNLALHWWIIAFLLEVGFQLLYYSCI